MSVRLYDRVCERCEVLVLKNALETKEDNLIQSVFVRLEQKMLSNKQFLEFFITSNIRNIFLVYL